MMGSYSFVLFSLLLISSVVVASSLESSFAQEIIATSTGFENSTILELKNARGNTANIDTVRIWLSGENEFKSFKTEQGWMGKNTPQGVIIFTSQNQVNPGEDVKFGIKTTKLNPIINWKAIDENGTVITSASTRITISETDDDNAGLNKSDIIGVKDDSTFRFIPERPSSDSDFRVIGENFVPDQSLDFYIGDDFDQTIKVDSDGRILFTSKTPKIQDGERTEFVLRDSGGSEKTISLRVTQSENREISQVMKVSIGNTPKEVKRGETVILSGMATPNSTLTVTLKHPDGIILNIDTIQVGVNGKWNLDVLIPPEIELGQIGIDVSDGKTTIHRNFDVISAVLINVFSEETMYQPGETVQFSGKALSGKEMSIILEDSIGTEIFSRSIGVGDSGIVDFEIEIPRESVEGTYILYLFQQDEEGITTFGVGQEPEAILILNPTRLNFSMNEDVEIFIQSVPNAQVSLILIDSADRERFSDNINLGPDGRELYKISAAELSSGAYTISGKRGESTDDAKFTIGFTTGSGSILVQTTKSEYQQSEQVLILGSTDSINVLLDITITDPNGKTIKRIDTFSDRFGVFKIDNFRIPADGKLGVWAVNAKSGGNFDSAMFTVLGNNEELIIKLDKDNYNSSEMMTISGTGAEATVSLKIFNSEGDKVNELNIIPKDNGEFSTIWMIPSDMSLGEYEMIVDDGIRNTSIKFTVS
jgi:hypothetical protein